MRWALLLLPIALGLEVSFPTIFKLVPGFHYSLPVWIENDTNTPIELRISVSSDLNVQLEKEYFVLAPDVRVPIHLSFNLPSEGIYYILLTINDKNYVANVIGREEECDKKVTAIFSSAFTGEKAFLKVYAEKAYLRVILGEKEVFEGFLTGEERFEFVAPEGEVCAKIEGYYLSSNESCRVSKKVCEVYEKRNCSCEVQGKTFTFSTPGEKEIGVVIENIGNAECEYTVTLNGKSVKLKIPPGEKATAEFRVRVERDEHFLVLAASDDFSCSGEVFVEYRPVISYEIKKTTVYCGEGETAEASVKLKNTGTVETEFCVNNMCKILEVGEEATYEVPIKCEVPGEKKETILIRAGQKTWKETLRVVVIEKPKPLPGIELECPLYEKVGEEVEITLRNRANVSRDYNLIFDSEWVAGRLEPKEEKTVRIRVPEGRTVVLLYGNRTESCFIHPTEEERLLNEVKPYLVAAAIIILLAVVGKVLMTL